MTFSTIPFLPPPSACSRSSIARVPQRSAFAHRECASDRPWDGEAFREQLARQAAPVTLVPIHIAAAAAVRTRPAAVEVEAGHHKQVAAVVEEAHHTRAAAVEEAHHMRVAAAEGALHMQAAAEVERCTLQLEVRHMPAAAAGPWVVQSAPDSATHSETVP